MIALPGQLFYTTQIPVCLWFISKDKRGNNEKGLLKRRDRQGETLFIDAREMGSMVNRTLKELTNDDIAKITQTYHIWRGEELTTETAESDKEQEYADVAGYCKSATLADIKANDYVLTPGRYVGAADIADDGIPFETKMSELSQTLYSQMNQADELDSAIRKNLQALGYGDERFAEKRNSEERND
jgi:type I restriction enzyme M protein